MSDYTPRRDKPLPSRLRWRGFAVQGGDPGPDGLARWICVHRSEHRARTLVAELRAAPVAGERYWMWRIPPSGVRNLAALGVVVDPRTIAGLAREADVSRHTMRLALESLAAEA